MTALARLCSDVQADVADTILKERNMLELMLAILIQRTGGDVEISQTEIVAALEASLGVEQFYRQEDTTYIFRVRSKTDGG